MNEEVTMQKTKHMDEDIFADVLKKIRLLTTSQRKFIQEMIVPGEKTVPESKVKLLRKSYGIWAGRKDIKDSSAYVAALRKGWNTRLERGKH